MANPRAFFEDHAPRELRGRLRGALPEDVTVTFHIRGPGGGAWQVTRRRQDVVIGPISDGPKDCQIHCSADLFMAILEGDVDPREAFFAGRLQLRGDVGLALRLRGILAAA